MMKKFNETIRNLITKQEKQQPPHMVLRQTREDATAVRRFVPSSVKVEWVSKQPDDQGQPLCVRKPETVKKEFRHQIGFTAAGKVYKSVSQLTAFKSEDSHFCKDIYGREVLCFWERFPCFDSYDYLYEDRYYRWFFIRRDDKLTLVYSVDTRPKIEVTEDVQEISTKWWEEIQKYWG